MVRISGLSRPEGRTRVAYSSERTMTTELLGQATAN